ncbi:ABC transporter permease family protein [Halostagnicola bangensis]
MKGHWIDGSVLIARTEWQRLRRESDSGRLWAERRFLLVALLAISGVLGAASHAVGTTIASQGAIPVDELGIVAGLAFVSLVWRSSQITHRRFERLNPDFLLTTVSARTGALGLVLFVSARVALFLAGPTLGVAVGTAIGLRSPLVALTITAAIGGLAAVAVGLGIVGRLAAGLVGQRLTRGGFYRDLAVVFGWLPLLVGWLVLQETSVSLAPLVGRLEALPITWTVDLAFLGATELGVDARRGLGAIAGILLTVPVLVGATTALARRIWECEPDSSASSHGSHSLLEEGRIERLLGDRVSRSALTVARERWLMERRVPRGVLSAGYAFLWCGVLAIPAFVLGGSANIPLLFFALMIGLSVGLAFASDPVGTEYRVMPMLLTTVPARQFVTGLVLASTVAGVVLAVLLALIGFASPVGVLETVVIVFGTIAISACAASVSLAVGMGVERYEFVPVPFFFTDAPIFAEMGSKGFRRIGRIFVVVSIAVMPALLGNLEPVYETAATFGVPPGWIQFGSLLLAICLAGVIARNAYQTAIERYQQYQIR